MCDFIQLFDFTWRQVTLKNNKNLIYKIVVLKNKWNKLEKFWKNLLQIIYTVRLSYVCVWVYTFYSLKFSSVVCNCTVKLAVLNYFPFWLNCQVSDSI